MTYKPLITSLPACSNRQAREGNDGITGIDAHCQRLQDKRTQGQKRITGLQDRIRALQNGFLLVHVVNGVPVRWDDVRLTVREQEVSL